MERDKDVRACFSKASHYVVEGLEQILTGKLDEEHSVSPSPGATVLGALALLAMGRGFENAQQRGIEWLRQNYQGGWGKFPGDSPDEEITRIANMVLDGSQGGWIAKIRLLSQARQFSQMILSVGQRAIPSLEGPTPEEILLPAILEDHVLTKLPFYGRPVVIAAAVLCTDSQEGLRKGTQYLLETQISDGSWSEDIIATSLAVLAILRNGGYAEQAEKAGRWLVRKQYPSGAWPAFNQLETWAVGWAVCIFGETATRLTDFSWLNQAAAWLKQGQNADGSYGSTPPFTHPDFDDTAVALTALKQVGQQNDLGFNLLRRLQNPDGSWGTFPDFRGSPPQISSEFPVYIPSVDVTIHVLEALRQRSRPQDELMWRGLLWVLAQQDDQGVFPASWFEGSVYSTAQALELFSKLKLPAGQRNTLSHLLAATKKGLDFLLNAQQTDGSWGSVVETGLALSGLIPYSAAVPREVLDKGVNYLLGAQNSNGSFKPSYRGIYAKGWNYEEPLSTALTAVRALHRYQLNRISRPRSGLIL